MAQVKIFKKRAQIRFTWTLNNPFKPQFRNDGLRAFLYEKYFSTHSHINPLRVYFGQLFLHFKIRENNIFRIFCLRLLLYEVGKYVVWLFF